MLCPKCGGSTGVCDTRDERKENEVYRLRQCKICKHIFYTVEFQADENEDFMKMWASISRHKRDHRRSREKARKHE